MMSKWSGLRGLVLLRSSQEGSEVAIEAAALFAERHSQRWHIRAFTGPGRERTHYNPFFSENEEAGEGGPQDVATHI